MSAHVSLKVVTKDYFRDKATMKIQFLGCFSKAKRASATKKNRSFSDKFGMVMVGSDTYVLELSGYVSLEVAFKDYFRYKATMKT